MLKFFSCFIILYILDFYLHLSFDIAKVRLPTLIHQTKTHSFFKKNEPVNIYVRIKNIQKNREKWVECPLLHGVTSMEVDKV